MKYFVIAGEASGDLHGAALIEAIRACDPEAEVRFLGGDLMGAAASSLPEIHYREMAYMGFSEVIRHLPDIGRNMKLARHIIESWRPDAFIAIDYPSFNLRMAAYAKKRGVRTFYYIPPKVWAWKEGRVKTMRRVIDKIFAIFPFEPAFYRRHGMEVEYVGNPSVAEVDSRLARMEPVRDKEYIALVPGSRFGEIRNNLPVMDAVARRHPEFRAVVAAAPSIPADFYRQFTDLDIVEGETLEIMRGARAALVTSGTATLECALAGTPQVACYRGNGSRLTYAIMSRWLKIPWVTLPNLIADREVIPEMLMHHCNVDEVDAAFSPLLSDGPEREMQAEGYREIRRRLGHEDPASTAARAITAFCRETGRG